MVHYYKVCTVQMQLHLNMIYKCPCSQMANFDTTCALKNLQLSKKCTMKTKGPSGTPNFQFNRRGNVFLTCTFITNKMKLRTCISDQDKIEWICA